MTALCSQRCELPQACREQTLRRAEQITELAAVLTVQRPSTWLLSCSRCGNKPSPSPVLMNFLPPLQVLAKVRGLVDALPDVEDEVEAGEAYEYVLTGGTGSRAPPQAIKQGPPAAAGATAQQGQAGGAGTGTKGSNASTQHLSGPSSQQGQEAQEGSGAAAAAAADEDDDPFGLGEMLGSKSGPASGPGPATSARQQQQQQQAGGGGISKDDDDDPFGLDAMISKPVCGSKLLVPPMPIICSQSLACVCADIAAGTCGSCSGPAACEEGGAGGCEYRLGRIRGE
jgi:hypothetical protein